MKLVVVLTIFLGVLFSCSPEKIDGGPWVCTTVFMELKVYALQNGQPALLDSTYVIRKSTGQKITHPPRSNWPGEYVVLNDSYIAMTPDSFTIYGYQSGVKKLQKTYFIGNDTCHITASGRDTVTIQ